MHHVMSHADLKSGAGYTHIKLENFHLYQSVTSKIEGRGTRGQAFTGKASKKGRPIDHLQMGVNGAQAWGCLDCTGPHWKVEPS